MHINVQEGINLCSKNTAMGKEVTEWSQGHMKVTHLEGHGFNGSRDIIFSFNENVSNVMCQ